LVLEKTAVISSPWQYNSPYVHCLVVGGIYDPQIKKKTWIKNGVRIAVFNAMSLHSAKSRF